MLEKIYWTFVIIQVETENSNWSGKNKIISLKDKNKDKSQTSSLRYLSRKIPKFKLLKSKGKVLC